MTTARSEVDVLVGRLRASERKHGLDENELVHWYRNDLQEMVGMEDARVVRVIGDYVGNRVLYRSGLNSQRGCSK